MITRIRIKSFKSLESVVVDLGQVNVFIGANGSGKSNLLEAIGLLGAAASGRVDDESCYVEVSDLDSPNFISLPFLEDGPQHTYPFPLVTKAPSTQCRS